MLNVGGPFVLVADDDAAVCRLLEALLAESGHRVETTRDGRSFLAEVDRRSPDLVVIGDPRLLAGVKERRPETVAIVLGASVDGAFDAVPKPVDRDRFLTSVRNAVTVLEQARELRRLRAEVHDAYTVERLVGSSAKMFALRARVRELAASGATAFVRGESGTGRELVARVIHYAGARSAAPFMDAHGAATPERELFDRIERAGSGTVYVEELGAMEPAVRARLVDGLRAGPRWPARLVASGSEHAADVLPGLEVATVDVPPLRERLEDLPELAEHFLRVAARLEGRTVPALSDETRRILANYRWPGNVRELENAMHRAVVLCDAGRVEPPHLPPPLNKSSGYYRVPDAPKNLVEAVEDLEKRMIREAMEKAGWVRAAAARELGVTERALAYKVDIYGITKDG